MISLNFWLRYVSELDETSLTASALGIRVDEYLEADMNVRWKVTDDFEMMQVGQNLLSPKHMEFISKFLTIPVEIERRVYRKLGYKF